MSVLGDHPFLMIIEGKSPLPLATGAWAQPASTWAKRWKARLCLAQVIILVELAPTDRYLVMSHYQGYGVKTSTAFFAKEIIFGTERMLEQTVMWSRGGLVGNEFESEEKGKEILNGKTKEWVSLIQIGR